MRTGEPFAFAGLWSLWRDPEGNRIPSRTIITTAANDLLRSIHDRMPVILPKEMEEFWLNGGVEDPAALSSVLNPHAASAMDAYEVSNLVNSAVNDVPPSLRCRRGHTSTRQGSWEGLRPIWPP